MGKPRIAIIGTGLIGTSIGLALKAKELDWEIIGHDKDLSAARKAQKLGAVDKVQWNLINACEVADFIVLAIPISAIESTLAAIAQDLKTGCVILDTANLKTPVLAWAAEILPATVSFVGGDPIINPVTEEKEPSAALFRGRPFCLTPAPDVAAQAIEAASAFVAHLGAEPYFIDAVEHDGMIAGVEHLPYVAAAALARITTSISSWRDMRKVAGQTYRITTQPIAGAPESYYTGWRDNRENLLRWVDEYIACLGMIRELIADDDSENLEEILDKIFAARAKWVHEVYSGEWRDREPPEMPEPRGLFKQLFGIRR